ncbi:ABC transporter ATP-binding protein [Ketogulonicigenium vulgare]|uniref:ABC transporter ATP-binding protein n=1 Tax=Ketogulonicigenium vulgare TaxID=92945 RepID=UPI002358B811|nr:ABC transporter ATP-binding protein [Ketogulonicigenium vulgare]
MTSHCAPTPPRIEVVDLVKSYRRENGTVITPVDHIDLIVAQNELVVLLGPSGCGKTTLLRCVAGLEGPDSGEIIVDGKVVFSSRKGIYEPPDRRALAMVFQSYALWPHMTVAQNVAFPLQSQKVATPEINERVSKALSMVGVGGLERQFPGRISGGQQQRVALARALVTNSSVVLFDEPLSNVDAQVRAQLRFELQSMQRRLQFSGLYVTHDQAEAMELGQRVAVLDNGKISAIGAPWEVYDRPTNEYVARFIGVANMWRGTVTCTGTDVCVETPLGPIRVHGGGASHAVGTALTVVARPEKLTLTAERPTGDTNAIPVMVEAVMFSGAHTEVVCRAGDGSAVTVWTGAHEATSQLARMGTAWLCALPADLRLVPTGAA